MDLLAQIVDYLKKHDISLATAESCTAGLVVSELARVPGSAGFLDCGLVVYSPESKHRYLNVSFDTIERYGLTSEEVALEMAEGALNRNDVNLAIADTGVAGPAPPNDDTPIGEVCFAWVVRCGDKIYKYSETRNFDGDRNEVRMGAAHYLLEKIPKYHRKALNKDT